MIFIFIMTLSDTFKKLTSVYMKVEVLNAIMIDLYTKADN